MPKTFSTSHIASSQRPAGDAEVQVPGKHPDGGLPTLIAACVSGFLFQFDLTALSAALPDIASSLSTQTEYQAWVIDIYSLALIFALPLAGPVADRYGRRRSYMAGTIIFVLASVLCATAQTFAGLLAWRVLQGISGAALTASASALLAAAYPNSRRAWAFGISGTVIGASMVAGPPIGAFIATNLGWPWVFWINIPICLGLMLLIGRTAKDNPDSNNRTPLDWAGPALLALCMGAVAFLMLSDYRSTGLAIPLPIAIGGLIAGLILFVRIERRHVAPAFDFALFGSSQFVAMCIVPIASSIGFWSLLVHLPQMTRGPMGLSPIVAGFIMTALTLPMFLLPLLGSKLAGKLSARWYFAGGLGIIGGADLLLAFAALDFSAPAALWIVVSALLVAGSGSALFNAQITAAAVSAVSPDRAATASAICVTMRQIGFAFGIALIATILQQDHLFNYTRAFAAVGGCTLGFATLVFILLSKDEKATVNRRRRSD